MLGSKKSTPKANAVDKDYYTKELPYVAFHRPNAANGPHQPPHRHQQNNHQDQHFSELCRLRQNKKHDQRLDGELPDLVPQHR